MSLMGAILGNNETEVQRLLDLGEDPNEKDKALNFAIIDFGSYQLFIIF